MYEKSNNIQKNYESESTNETKKNYSSKMYEKTQIISNKEFIEGISTGTNQSNSMTFGINTPSSANGGTPLLIDNFKKERKDNFNSIMNKNKDTTVVDC